MATYSLLFDETGAMEEHLLFMGCEYVFKRAPYRGGIARSLTRSIVDQLKDHYPEQTKLLERVKDLSQGFEDGQDVILYLTRLEQELRRDKGG